MTEELKPCPFCGGEAVIISATRRDVNEILPNGDFKTGYVEIFMARCTECGASSNYNEVQDVVAMLWNTRASKVIEEEAKTAKHLKEELADIVARLSKIRGDIGNE